MKKIRIRDINCHDLEERFYDAILVEVKDVYKDDCADGNYILFDDRTIKRY